MLVCGAPIPWGISYSGWYMILQPAILETLIQVSSRSKLIQNMHMPE